MVEGELDMVQQATLAAERLEKAVEENKEILKRMEAIEARKILGGQSIAGIPQKTEETAREYTARIMRGGV